MTKTSEDIGALYGAYAILLRGIAIKKFGVPEDEAATLVHDVFATYLERPDTIHDPRRYLVGAICNASRQYWRRTASQRRVFVHEPEDAAVEDEAFRRLTVQLAVGMVLSRLGPRCRETLRRYYLDEESTSDIAASFGTSRDYVRHILHTCRNRALVLLQAKRHS